MRIVCPSCHAIYDVPDALLATAGGRRPAKLRCARCATEWAPELPRVEPPPAPQPTPTPGPTPSAFADAITQATAQPATAQPATGQPAAAPPPEPPAPPPPPPTKPAPAARPLAFDRHPPRPAGEALIAEHLATGRPRPDPAPAHNPRDSATLLFAWILSVAVLVALLVAAYLHRAEVIAFWPPAARAYDLLGLK